MKTYPILQGKSSRLARFCIAVIGIVAMSGLSQAQDSLVALGRVASNGTVTGHHFDPSGGIGVITGGVGEYEITFSLTDGFTGATVDDFHVGVTIEEPGTNDDAAMVDVSFVDADTLVVDVYTADLEDADSLISPEARNRPFFFQVYRIPAGAFVNSSSTAVLSSGRVAIDGSLLGGVNAYGAGVVTTQMGPGTYEVRIPGPGRFASDDQTDYYLALSLRGTINGDRHVRGAVSDTSSADEVVFDVFVDDVQNTDDNDNPDPEDNEFCFVIYRSDDTADLPPGSSLLGAISRVDSGGNLVSGATSYPGSTIQAESISTGVYTVTIAAPDAYAGKTDSDYSLQLQVHDTAIDDNVPFGNIEILDSSTMQVEVRISDVEQNIAGGTPRNAEFSLMIMDATAEAQSDLLIGKDSSSVTMVGDDVYSMAAGSQRLRVRSKKSSRARFYFSAGNDGNVTRDIAVASVKKIKGVKPKFFLLTGGRSNVTAAVKSSGAVVSDVAPDASALFEAKTKPKRGEQKRKSKILLRCIDVASGAAQDLVEARLKMPR